MIDWNFLYQSDDLDKTTNDVVNLITKISNKHAPIKKVSRTKQKQLNKPWISNGILKSIKNKQHMYSTHFHSNNIEKINRYKAYANKLNYIISRSKKRYFDNQFQICKNNLKDTWKLIGSLINRKQKGEIHPDRLVRNGKVFTTPYDIADQFNSHFINVGPSLANLIPDYDNSDPTTYIHNSPVSSFVMSTVTESQVSKLFSELNVHKASLGLPNKLIKIASKQLSVPFTFIYNKSITLGVVPDIFKISRVTPIYKNGNITDPMNYRPISILTAFSKVLEKIVYNQMILFLEKHKILFPYQFGFRKGYSTEQAILEMTDSVKTAIDQKQLTCGVFLDFSKAFDTVNHQILLSKLDKYGFRGIPHSWFTDYLTNCKQFVKVGEAESNKLQMLCGVLQGSTLGPLLFLLYINDISNCSDKLSFRIFADDTSVFYSCQNVNELEIVMNDEIQALLKYCTINKLSVNFKKTNFIVFRSPKRKNIKIHLKNITQANHVKYLGVYLDEYFNWEHQIKHINIKVNKNVGIISKLRHYVDLKMLKQLYYSLIYPYLNYGIMSWGNTYTSKLTKIHTKQNKCLRNIFFAHWRENASPYFKLLGILKLDNIFKIRIATMCYIIAHEKKDVPSIFLNFITLAKSTHFYNTRFASNLNFSRPTVRTNYGIYTFKYVASKLWEQIPHNLKNIESIYQFKKQYKLFLLEEQSSE